MERQILDRRTVARELGLTYSTLRVYEKNLEGVLPRAKGANRTTLFDGEAIRILRTAIGLKKSGWPFSKLAEHFRGPSPAEGPDLTLERIRERTEQILSLGQRIEARLMDMEQRYRSLGLAQGEERP